MAVLDDVYGDLLVVRAPVPATCNKAGANYKSEVTHRDYSPRRAYDEWLSILDGIVACGGDAIYAFDAVDDVYLDHDALEVDAFGEIRPAGSAEVLGNLRDVETGRVFTANGPWVTLEGGRLRAVMQHMLPHRRGETRYYRDLLGRIADAIGRQPRDRRQPAPLGGHGRRRRGRRQGRPDLRRPRPLQSRDPAQEQRSSREGVTFAADTAGVPPEDRIYAELVYPHFHGDTVHFGARPAAGPPVLVHYPGGLWGDGPDRVLGALGLERSCRSSSTTPSTSTPATRARSAAVCSCPTGSARASTRRSSDLGLTVHGSGSTSCSARPAAGRRARPSTCRGTLKLPADAPFRYSATRDAVRARRERIPERLTVDPDFFEGKPRG